MSRSYRKLSRETGLEIGSVLGRYFLKLDHLHYGYWTDDLEVDISNLHKAQQNYTDFLISHIPEGMKTILDVGCGGGKTARKLIDIGYQVDCLSPSRFLCKQASELLGNTAQVFECEYEQLETEKRYDLILFSESFQYIKLEEALQKSMKFLNSGGYLLISDIFRIEAEKKSVISGGHELREFYEVVAHYPLEPVKDLDITEATAPNIGMLDDVLKNVVQPILNSGMRLNGRYPVTSRIVQWKYRKQIDKKYNKYFSGGRTAEDFKKFRSYKLLLYKKHSKNL